MQDAELGGLVTRKESHAGRKWHGLPAREFAARKTPARCWLTVKARKQMCWVMDAEPKSNENAAAQSEAGLSAEKSEMLGKFLLAPVPRGKIPLEIRRAAKKGIDWTPVYAGVIVLLMGLVLIFAASPASVLNDWKLDREHREVTGVITYANVTLQKTSRGGSFYRYEYVFEFIPDYSTSMMLGRYYASDGRGNVERWRAGDKVQIWYLPGNASVARIQGTHLGSWSMLGVGLIMLAFDCVIWWSVIRSRKRLEWLLANGLVGEFRVTNVTWVSGSRQRTAHVRVECERVDDKIDDGCYRGVLFKQPKKKMKLAQSLKDSRRTVFGLYDPLERERGKERRRLEIPETWFW